MNSSTFTTDVDSRQVRVIKVGGSLFTLPDLKQRLVDWARTIADDRFVNVWIVGGGGFVNEVRKWQSLHSLEPDLAHQFSVNLMSQTAALFQAMFIDWPLLSDIQQLGQEELIATPNVVFDCCHWALNTAALERTWKTTSDSISLQVAIAVGASQLFLLKSKSPKSDQIAEAIQAGLIDQNFAAGCNEESGLRGSTVNRKKSQLRALIVNLRESEAAVEMFW